MTRTHVKAPPKPAPARANVDDRARPRAAERAAPAPVLFPRVVASLGEPMPAAERHEEAAEHDDYERASKPHTGFIVDGDPGPSQMSKPEFIALLRREILAAAEQELAGTDWTAEHCPWIEHWFSYYARRSARDGEAALRKYAPDVRAAVDAAGYIEPAVERVRLAIRRWRRTGEIDAPTVAMPAVEQTLAALGPGRPLEASTRSRMERAAGADFSNTRVHDDEIGARAAASQQARAFAIGEHIAFANGEYQPGTVEGDALLAHELAHTQQQAGASRASSTTTSEHGAERDANRATRGILARLLGVVAGDGLKAPRPVLATGLQLQRCPPNLPKDYYEEDAPHGVYLEATPHLIERDGVDTAIVGQTVRFRPASTIQGVRPTTNRWHAYMIDEYDDPTGHDAGKPKWDTGFPVDFDAAGLWMVRMEIHVGRKKQEKFVIGRRVTVIDPKELAAQGAATLKPIDYSEFRFKLGYRTLVDFGVQKDQSATAPRDENKQPHSYIISGAKTNPMDTQEWDEAGIEFKIVPHRDAATFKWHQYFDNPEKHPAKHFGGGSIHDLGTGKTQTIKLDRPDLYTIVCEQFDAKGNQLPTARYLQSVLLGEDWKKAKKWHSYIEGVDKLIADLDPATRKQVPGVYVNVETGEAMPLAVFTGKSIKDPKRHVVLDLMFGIGPKRFSDTKLDEAFDDFEEHAVEKYPKGRIYLAASAVGEKDRQFATKGKSWLGELADYLGLGAVGLSVIGFGLMLVGAEPAAFAFFAGAAALGAGASGVSLYHRFSRGEADPLGVTIDIIGLAVSVLQGAHAFKMAVKTASTGKTAAELIVSSSGTRFVAWTETGLLAASGVLITAESLLALGELSDSSLSEGEKADRIASLLWQILAQGGMMALQAKNLGQVEAAFRGRKLQLAELEKRVLAQLDDKAIAGLKNIPDADIPRVVAQVVDDPAAATKILAEGKVTSADDLGKALHPSKAPTPEPAPPEPPTVTKPTPTEPAPPEPPTKAPTGPEQPVVAEEPAPATKKKKRPTFQQRKTTMATAVVASEELEKELAARKAAGFTDSDIGTLRRWGKAFERLKQNGSALTAKELVGDLKPNFSESAYKKFRYRLFDAILDDVLQPKKGVPTRSQAEQASRLRAYIKDMPDSASKGSLYSKYRTARFAAPGDIQTIEGVKKSLDDPGKVMKKSRDADGAMTIKDQEANGGPPDGAYGIDDKAGESFDPKQATDISALADSPQGLSMGGKKLDGYVYWCEDQTHADTVTKQLDKLKLSDKLHVAYIDSSGVVQWSR